MRVHSVTARPEREFPFLEPNMAENNSSAPLKTAEGAVHPHLIALRTIAEYPATDSLMNMDAANMRRIAAQAVAAQAAPAAVAVPPKAITASLMLDDGGERPVFCLMAAYPSEADARAALAALAATPSLPATEDSSAGDLATESVLIEGVAYTIPEPVALELLRLNIELQQAEVQAEPVAQVLGWVHRKNGKIGNHFHTYEPHCDCAVRDDGGEKIAVIAATAPQAQPADALLLHALELAYDHIEMDSLRISHCKDEAVIDAAMAAAQEGGAK